MYALILQSPQPDSIEKLELETCKLSQTIEVRLSPSKIEINSLNLTFVFLTFQLAGSRTRIERETGNRNMHVLPDKSGKIVSFSERDRYIIPDLI